MLDDDGPRRESLRDERRLTFSFSILPFTTCALVACLRRIPLRYSGDSPSMLSWIAAIVAKMPRGPIY